MKAYRTRDESSNRSAHDMNCDRNDNMSVALENKKPFRHPCTHIEDLRVDQRRQKPSLSVQPR